MAHVPKASDNPIAMCSTSTGPRIKVHTYDVASPHFVIPSSGKDSFSPSSAVMAHTRSLVFLRSHIGGPFFDIEEIWEEHTFFEFVDRSVAKTMGTMVVGRPACIASLAPSNCPQAEPYVNHVPTMTGGVGRTALAEFYRDHFIFSYVHLLLPANLAGLTSFRNPASAELVTVSRTVGPDRVVDEFVFRCVHDRMIDWLLPGVPPSGNQLEIPMIAVVNVRGDRLYHEHIWWCVKSSSEYLAAARPPRHSGSD
jgi:carboxymethylenebutenolidase